MNTQVQGPAHGKPDTGAEVTIYVNGVAVEIHRGNQSVVTIKQTANVPLAYDLEQEIEGRLVPLTDSSAVVLKGGERFHSHPRDAGSS